jgi:hypothetical protein
MTLDRELPLTYPGESYANRTPHGFHVARGFCRIARSLDHDRLESDHDLILLFEHDLRANASRLSRGKTGSHPRVKPEGMLFRIML